MPICLELSASVCRLLIWGGSGQAHKKAAAFLAQGAAVTVNAAQFCPALQALGESVPCPPPGRPPAPGQLRLVAGPFEPALLGDATLFLAATGDREQNRRAVALAQARGRIALSVTGGAGASARFLKAEEIGGLTLACGTGGAYPALNVPLLAALRAAARPFGSKLPLLRTLRGRVLGWGVPRQLSTPWLRALSGADPDSLKALCGLTDEALQAALARLAGTDNETDKE